MKKHKIVYFGDHSDRINQQFLKELHEKSDGSFEIFVTGYETARLDRNFESDDIHIIGMNSPERFYHEYTSDTVIVTAGSVERRKICSNQRTIYYMKQFDRKAFAGTAGDIDEFYSPSEDTVSEIAGLFSHVKASYMAEDLFVDFLIRSLADVSEKNDPELFVMMGKEVLPEAAFRGSRAYLFSGMNDVAGDFVQIRPDYGIRTKGFLSLFSGVVKYSSEESKKAFLKYVNDNSIDFTPSKECLYEGETLQHNESFETDLPDHVTDRSVYRKMLEDYYIEENCHDVTISIVMTRYNTPVEFVLRALESITKCGHENIELIFIDDGSKDDIRNKLPMHMKGIELKYYYFEDNRGMGEARNEGVEKATGTYIFFMDCDDTMHPDCFKYILAHAVHYDLDAVVGLRIIADPEGKPFHESFRILSGDTFKVYHTREASDLYSDVMITNDLIKRTFLSDNNIWFTNRIYEDVDYCARVYYYAKVIHYTSIPVFFWHQYGNDTSISSSISISHFQERLKMETRAWEYVPEKCRSKHIRSLIANDFSRFISGWCYFSENEKEAVFHGLYDFFNERKVYFPERGYSERTEELKTALLNKDRPFFDYVSERYFYRSREGSCRYHIVSTHSQLLAACLLALEDGNRDRLVINSGYDLFDLNMLYRIKTSGLFDDVTMFSDKGLEERINTQIEKRPDEGHIVKATMMNNVFAYALKSCEYSKDTFLCYDIEYAKYLYPEYLLLRAAVCENKDSKEIIASSFKKRRSAINEIMGHIYNTDTTGVRDPDVYCVRHVRNEVYKSGKGSILAGILAENE